MLETKEIISDDAEIKYKENTLTVEDFQELRTAVGWFKAQVGYELREKLAASF